MGQNHEHFMPQRLVAIAAVLPHLWPCSFLQSCQALHLCAGGGCRGAGGSAAAAQGATGGCRAAPALLCAAQVLLTSQSNVILSAVFHMLSHLPS